MKEAAKKLHMIAVLLEKLPEGVTLDTIIRLVGKTWYVTVNGGLVNILVLAEDLGEITSCNSSTFQFRRAVVIDGVEYSDLYKTKADAIRAE